MIENTLINKYEDYLDGLDIYENKNSLRLSKIVIKPEYRNLGFGKKIMTDLINYADEKKKIITLTPSSDFGGNKNKLTQFYKKFGFKLNKGYHKNYEFNDAMIRYPKLNETTKSNIKTLLREALIRKEELDIRTIADFTNFAKEFLGITDDVKVKLAFERTPELATTAYYNTNGFLVVYAKDRLLADIKKSIAHELTHHLQNLQGRLNNPIKDGEDGSPIENEANAKAGEIIRKWGKLHPEIYYKTL